MEYVSKDIVIDNKKIRVKIWDTAGQEQYRSITCNFYRNADGIIVVYDATNRETFDKVGEWLQSIDDYTPSDSQIPVILVGNKIDLPKEVSTEEGKQLAENKGIPFFETTIFKSRFSSF